MPTRRPAEERPQRFEDRFVFLECLRYRLVGRPGVGIEPRRARHQLLALDIRHVRVRLEARDDIRVPGTQSLQTEIAEPGVTRFNGLGFGGIHRLHRLRRERFDGPGGSGQLSLGRAFERFSRFDRADRFHRRAVDGLRLSKVEVRVLRIIRSSGGRRGHVCRRRLFGPAPPVAAFATPFLAWRPRAPARRRTRRIPRPQGTRRSCSRLEACPIERDVRIVLLEEPHRLLIERLASDADRRWRTEEIQQALPFPAAAARLDESGRFVAAAIAVETEVRQNGYLLGFFFAAGFAFVFGFGFAPDGGLLVAAGVRSGLGAAAGRGGGVLARCTSVKRVWSPIE